MNPTGTRSAADAAVAPQLVQEALDDLVGLIHGQPREGQTAMALAVAQTMAGQRHLVVQAGTGTGKSYAYLVPALLHSVATDQTVLVSTATLALQRQLMAKDIPTVLSVVAPKLPRPPRVALLKGRGNYLCRLRMAESGAAATGPAALFELPGRLERQAEVLRGWAQETSTGDRDDLPEPVDGRVWRSMSATGRECVGRQRCPVGADCFAEAARDAAASADVVLTNHTLLSIDLAGGSAALPEYEIAIIDEAHDMASRMTAASTEVLAEAATGEALRLCGGMLSSEVSQLLDAAGDDLAGALRDLEGQRRLRELPQQLVRALAQVRDASHAAITELGAAATSDAPDLARRQAATAAVTELHDRAGLMLGGDERLVRWVGSDPMSISCAPLSVADRIGGCLLPRATVVATSATLQIGGSFAALAADWGFSPVGADWQHLDVGSPFDYARQGILYVPRDLPAPGREDGSAALLARIGALVRAAGGRALVLSSSWRGVDAIAEYLADADIPGVDLLVQERGSPPGPLIAAFAEQHGAVLVGTLSLWQGVDVPGPSCSLVVMDKIPFPRPDDPVLAARSEAAQARGLSGFGTVSLPHAGLLLAQGAGRLIRRADDRGVVAVLDPRLQQRSYGSYLLRSMPPMWRTADLEVVVAALRRLAESASDPS